MNAFERWIAGLPLAGQVAVHLVFLAGIVCWAGFTLWYGYVEVQP